MEIDSVRSIYFSPTGTTRRILEGVARGIRADRVTELNLTSPDSGAAEPMKMGEALAIVGAPVYGGRLPEEAARRLRRLKGELTPAVVVVVYGNRAYEDALLELKDLAAEAGFVPVAGGAFIGEHSFSTAAVPIAQGRPDLEDLRKAEAFGVAIRARFLVSRSLADLPPLEVPGQTPYKNWKMATGVSPVTRTSACGRCGTCAGHCPTAAIAMRDSVSTDLDLCIHCCACVKNCPAGARIMNDPGIVRSAGWLSENCAERKEPEVYMA